MKWQGTIRCRTGKPVHVSRVWVRRDSAWRLILYRPPPLISAHLFNFGDTVMMNRARAAPNAKPYWNARMWVKRDGRWQMLFSFNTRIE